MLMLLESTLLGAMAGTRKTGRRPVTYQIQMPMKNKEADNSKIRELSDALEIVYKGAYDVLGKKVPIDIIITLTWVVNRQSAGVFQRYKNHPYLRITISFDSKGKFRISPSPRVDVLACSTSQTVAIPAQVPSRPRIWNGPQSSPILLKLHAPHRSTCRSTASRYSSGNQSPTP